MHPRPALFLALTLASCAATAAEPHLAPAPSAAPPGKIPSELQRCLDFARRLDAIERRFLPTGARDGDPVAALLAYVERETGCSTLVEDGCAIDTSVARAVLDAITYGPASVRSALGATIRDSEPQLAWITDGARLHLVREHDVDAWLERLPEPEFMEQARKRLSVVWNPAVVERGPHRYDEDVVVTGALLWRAAEGSTQPLACSLHVAVQVALADGATLGPPGWDASRECGRLFSGTDLGEFYDTPFGDPAAETTIALAAEPDGSLRWSMAQRMLQRREGESSDHSIAVWLPCADRLIAGKVRARIGSTPGKLRIAGT